MDIAIIDLNRNVGKRILNIPIIGTDEDLKTLYLKGYGSAFVAVGSLGDSELRRRLFDLVCSIGFQLPTIIDSSAIISSNVSIGDGVFIGKGVIVNAGAIIHKASIINTGALIEHDCVVGEFTHVAPRAVLCGDVSIEKEVHIGAGAIVKQNITVSKNSIIGMGSIVLKDIPPYSIAYGNPCIVHSYRNGEDYP